MCISFESPFVMSFRPWQGRGNTFTLCPPFLKNQTFIFFFQGNDASIELGELGTGEDGGDGEGSSEIKRAVINVNESIVTLLLRLHSKISCRPDSYVPKSHR